MGRESIEANPYGGDHPDFYDNLTGWHLLFGTHIDTHKVRYEDDFVQAELGTVGVLLLTTGSRR